MSSAESTNWREKYLQSLAVQDKFQRELTLLKKAVSRVCLAAEAHQSDLDEHITGVSEASKEGGQALERALNVLDETLRRTADEAPSLFKRPKKTPAAETVLVMAKALQSHTQDNGLKRELKGFIHNLKSESGTDATALLKTLSYFQDEVLRRSVEHGGQKVGFLKKLFTPTTDTPVSESELSPEPPKVQSTAPDQQAVPLEPVREPSSESASNPVTEEADSQVTKGVDNANKQPIEGDLQTRTEVELEATFQRPVHEPAFSRVSDKVQRVLVDLLDNVEPVACTEQKAVNARDRIERGLNWYELVPTLEDIRDLVLQAYLLADEEYRQYLKQLDEVLGGILDALGVTVQSNLARQQEEEKFEAELRLHLGSLSRSVSVTTEVESLKQDIQYCLSSIQKALEAKHNAESSHTVDQQLSTLFTRVQELEQEATQAQEELQQQKQKAITDTLTGLPNREAYNQRAHLEWSRWQRYGNPLSLVVVDIDHFKRINDTYGHQTGDRVLQVLSKAVTKRLRSVDFMARFGGEEFVVLLPETDLENAYLLMDKIRKAIAGTPFRFKENPVQVTISCGLVMLQEGDTLEAAFARADELLYKAKESGRNCCMK